MRRTFALSIALALSCWGNGCGTFGYEVVRVHEGRPRAERFVSDEAYAASLEAALAEDKGDWPAAVEALRKARDEDPDAADLQARLGLALCHVGQREAASSAFDDALRMGDQLERVYTARAGCDLLSANVAAARHDLGRAIATDPEALEPALMLVELDLRENRIAEARTRAEEATLMHPTAGHAFRLLAEALVRQGEIASAIDATKAAMRIDEVEGQRAREIVLPFADLTGVAAWSLSLRSGRLSQPMASGDTKDASKDTAEEDARCRQLFAMLSSLASKGSENEIAIAAEAVGARCPTLEDETTLLEAEATWTASTADAVETRALASASPRARRWAARAKLRHLTTTMLLARDALPKAEDQATLALELARSALVLARGKGNDVRAVALAKVAQSLSLAEPTVARLVAEVAKYAGNPASDPMRSTACALARTEIEKQACTAS